MHNNSHVVLAQEAWWLILTSALTFLMQIGFVLQSIAAVKTTSTTAVAVAATCGIAIGVNVWCLIGNGLAIGKDLGGVVGTDSFLMQNVGTSQGQSFAEFLSSVIISSLPASMFCGSVIERMPITSNLMNIILVGIFVYPIVYHWIDSPDGWLKARGFVDVTGATSVTVVGGFCGMVATAMLGPRRGRFDKKTGRALPMHSQNVAQLATGTWFLVLGWIGFNTRGIVNYNRMNSTIVFNASDSSTGRVDFFATDGDEVALVAVNTLVAATSAGTIAMLGELRTSYTINFSDVLDAVVGGVVVASACGPYIFPGMASALGALGGLVSIAGSSFVLNKLQIDDPQATACTFGMNGILGALSIGIVHRDKGFITSGNADLFTIQLLGVIVIVIYVVVAQYLILLGLLCAGLPLRVPARLETVGTDSELTRGTALYLAQETFNQHIAHQRSLVNEMISDKRGIRALFDFLKSRNQENLLLLYVATLRYESNKGWHTYPNLRHIHNTFIKHGATHEVQLGSNVTEEFNLRLQLPDELSLSRIKAEVYKLLSETCISASDGIATSESFREYVLETSVKTNKEWLLSTLESLKHKFRKKNEDRGGRNNGIVKKSSSSKVNESKFSTFSQKKKNESDLESNLKLLTQSVILLGARRSGKTQVRRQVALSWGIPIQTYECIQAVSSFRRNATEAIQQLVQGGYKLGILTSRAITTNKLNVACDAVMEARVEDLSENFTPALAHHITQLWQSPLMESVYSRRTEFPFLENGAYYLDNAERFINSPDEKPAPSVNDIVHSYYYKVDSGIVQSYDDCQNSANPDPFLSHIRWCFIDTIGSAGDEDVIDYIDMVQHVVYVIKLNGYNRREAEDLSQFQVALKDFMQVFNKENVPNESTELNLHLVFTHNDSFEREFDAEKLANSFGKQMMQFPNLSQFKEESLSNMTVSSARETIISVFTSFLSANEYECNLFTSVVSIFREGDIKQFADKLSNNPIFAQDFQRVADNCRELLPSVVPKGYKSLTPPTGSHLSNVLSKLPGFEYDMYGQRKQVYLVKASTRNLRRRLSRKVGTSRNSQSRKRLTIDTEGCPEPFCVD